MEQELKDSLCEVLGEMAYVLRTGDIHDSVRNGAGVRERAAQLCGYADYEAFVAGVMGEVDSD